MLKKLIIALLIVSMAMFCFVSCDDDDSSSETETTYAVGDTGPAGGIVFYDKGSYSDGWRYLEAAPADASGYYIFGYYRPSGTNYYVNDSTTYDASNCTGTAIGTGSSNTELLVNKMGSAAYSSYSGSGTEANYAAKLCSDLSYGGYDDWFLPSKDELAQMYAQKDIIGGFDDANYWSSSEANNTADYAWGQNFNDGNQNAHYRSNIRRVRPLRAF